MPPSRHGLDGPAGQSGSCPGDNGGRSRRGGVGGAVDRSSHSWRGGRSSSSPMGVSPPDACFAAGCLYGSSPDSVEGTPKSSFLLGTSPPTGGGSTGRDSKRTAAKNFWSRLLYDESLDPTEFQVVFVEVFTADQRRSGKGAWSKRQHEQTVELGFQEFKSRFPPKEVPYHCIVSFKQNGAIVWEASQSPSRESVKKDVCPALEVELSELSLEDCDLSVTSPRGDGPSASDGEALPVLELPAECWSIILKHLGARELCMLSRVSRTLRELSMQHSVWEKCYSDLFGLEPHCEYDTVTVRRLCRRSELRAARWIEAACSETDIDLPGITCMQVDNSKVISSDGSSIRLWSHLTGRRISKLQGQSSTVTCITCDDDFIVSGCTHGTVRVWGMDDLKFIRPLRGHNGSITDLKMLNGMPVSCSDDGTIRFWDSSQAMPVVTLESDSRINALEVDDTTGRLTSAGLGLEVWDIATAQRLVQLASPIADDPGDFMMFEMMENPDPSLGLTAFTSISQHGSTLAAGAGRFVSLWDLRTASRVHSLDLGDGLQMDDWKLLASVHWSPEVAMYDIRSISSHDCRTREWPSPVKTFFGSSDVTCFKFHGETLVVGASDGTRVWGFGRTDFHDHSEWRGATCGQEDQHQHGKSHKEKKKPVKAPKRPSKYPKRTTR